MRYLLYSLVLMIIFFCDGGSAEADPEPDPHVIISQYIISSVRRGVDLHGYCEKTKECKTPHAECINNKCMCKDKYHEHDGKCIPSVDLHGYCEKTEECKTPHAECINNTCICKDKYHEHDGKCIPKKDLHEACKTTSECATPHAECINNTCICGPKYKEVDGKCIAKPPLNDSCDSCVEHPPCADKHAVCYKNRCICKQGYENLDGICVAATPPQGEILGSCVPITGDCTPDNSECNAGTCECESLYVNVGPNCYRERNWNETCTYNMQCPDDMTCKCDVCDCKEGYIITSNSICEEIVETGQYCRASEQCTGLNTDCINNTCVCQDDAYGPSISVPNNCVSKLQDAIAGPISLNSTTLPYKPEYSNLTSPEYIAEAKEIIDNKTKQIVDVFIEIGLDVVEGEAVSVYNGTAGGTDFEILLTFFNPDYDKPAKLRRYSFIAPVTSDVNEDMLGKIRTALQALGYASETEVSLVPRRLQL